MYGKIDENGKFVGAPGTKSVTRDGAKIIIEHYTEKELEDMGFKKVRMEHGEGRPGPGKKPVFTAEDKGDYILRRMDWASSEANA